MRYFRLWRIVVSILALLYTFLPFDFLPDMLVGWGWLDDIIILYLLWYYFFRGRRVQPGSAGARAEGQQRAFGSAEHEQGRTNHSQNTARDSRCSPGSVPGRNQGGL